MNPANPLPAELSAQLSALSPTQLAWLSGYCWAQSQGAAATAAVAAAAPAPVRQITVLSASQTGNARRVAETLHAKLAAAGLNARLSGVGDFKSKSLPNEDIVLLVTSTQGEGEPPEEAVPLYQFLFGKKAPDLGKLSFAVLGLGDSSYPNFCQAGKDFDRRMAELGATRLLENGVCDLDFQAAADTWVEQAVAAVSTLAAQNTTAAAPTAAATENSGTVYTRSQPFAASLSLRQKITSRDADKDVEHIEIDLSGSGIHYQAGDALGVWPLNDEDLVAEILQLNHLNGTETVRLGDGSETDIQTALRQYLDITQNTPNLVQKYAELAAATELQEIGADSNRLADYLAENPPIATLAAHPKALDAQSLADLFRAQTPRLYSIASSQDEVGEEVHLTVGVVRFEQDGKTRTGAASGFLGERLSEGDTLNVFIEPNPHFRLPADGNTPIIMIGAGTGVAPFRSFMQQRDANGDSGKNWLIFGNRRFTDDFLYQTEWQQFHKTGLLTRADLAWSRQGNEKVYVQHKIRENAAELWAWLQQGAHIYVCGDAAKMAKDVEEALLDVIARQGKLDPEDAADYLNDLREDKRYQRDVY
ncbi:assimilatory sulfite reductase (NADPH) flavoprotein subunit [Neisseria lisongii]|uniref:Sulfite reductase [NADPH] flavoprotein alpha-component n=1 Tax=Neisseria lisongii TaxID=2912188 RepID=A0AAW5AFB0_9NEIS|nr:assimilatory sulfite reductase (NADPH) flavoprotein subunit [Neisseria lisongii]MCF7530009.1 assimilatory sulfite reductase (NADPH) flavoprotein subunit [Neisseria lisongii]